MADREKLIELLWQYDQMRMMRMSIEESVDKLIANGVTIQPLKIVRNQLVTNGYQLRSGCRRNCQRTKARRLLTASWRMTLTATEN